MTEFQRALAWFIVWYGMAFVIVGVVIMVTVALS